MAIALLFFNRIGNCSKLFSRIRTASLELNIRGLIKTGEPGVVLISSVPPGGPPPRGPNEKPPPETPKPLATPQTIRKMVAKVYRHDPQMALAHHCINDNLTINFPRDGGVKRAHTEEQFVEAARADGADMWVSEGFATGFWRIDELPGARKLAKSKVKLRRKIRSGTMPPERNYLENLCFDVAQEERVEKAMEAAAAAKGGQVS